MLTDHPNPGSILSELKLHRIIGKGGFADVFLATCGGAKCAVKVPKQHDCVQAAMFRRESAVQMEHPHANIVRGFGLIDISSNLVQRPNTTAPKQITAMVMELLEDGTVALLLARQMSQPHSKLYTNTDVLRWCVGLADGLAMLHAQCPQIIHRDIKAENIMLGAVGGQKRQIAKLCDFGLHVSVQNSMGDMVRQRSLCPSICGLATSLHKSRSRGIPRELLFHRSDDPKVKLKGVRPRPDVVRSNSMPDITPRMLSPSTAAVGREDNHKPHPINVSNEGLELLSGPSTSSGANAGLGSSDFNLPTLSPSHINSGLCQQGVCSLVSSCGQELLSTSFEHSHEYESVFRMTGNTGSAIYMSPEMHRNQPYNEKTDVYSFGILLYELFSRQLMALVVDATCRSLPIPINCVSDYPRLAAQGYRPAKPKSMSEEVWILIQICWHTDPVVRPSMAEVLSRLKELQEQESVRVAAFEESTQPSCSSCVIS